MLEGFYKPTIERKMGGRKWRWMDDNAPGHECKYALKKKLALKMARPGEPRLISHFAPARRPRSYKGGIDRLASRFARPQPMRLLRLE